MGTKKIIFAACVAFGSLLATSCKEDKDLMPSEVELQESEMDKLSKLAIYEFLAFAQNPRYGYHLDQAHDYLMNWARSHGFKCYTDAAQNVWFDVPATAGMESSPKVILQAHMDQICASAPGETYDYTKVVGEPYYEGNLLKGRKVNLGADDGSGVGMILALVSSNISHGEIRVLITTNEDYTMEGAATLSSDVLDAEYLINIDNEWLGEIAIGCYGGFSKDFIQHYQTMAPSAGQKKITFSVSGLKGGHSGTEIGKGHLSASFILAEMLNEVVDPYQGRIININCGTYKNAIPDQLTFSFVVNENDVDAVKKQVDAMVENYKRTYPEENGIWKLDVNNAEGSDKAHDSQAVTDLIELFGNVPQGVIEVDNATGRITKSNNIGVVTLTDGELLFKVFPRSDYSNWLEVLEKQYEALAASMGIELISISSTPVWESDGMDELTNLMVKCHNDLGIKNNVVKAPGGLEAAYFSQKNPALKCVSVGPTIDNAHSIDEALHVSTVKPLMTVIVNVLKNIGNEKM